MKFGGSVTGCTVRWNESALFGMWRSGQSSLARHVKLVAVFVTLRFTAPVRFVKFAAPMETPFVRTSSVTMAGAEESTYDTM